MYVTLGELVTEIGLYTRTRGAIEHQSADLKGLIGRCLYEFVEFVRPWYTVSATANVGTTGVIDLGTATWTVGSDTVLMTAVEQVWIASGNTILDKWDYSTMVAEFPAYAGESGTPVRWYCPAKNLLHVHPAPTVTTGLRVAGWRQAHAVNSSTSDSVVIDLPDLCIGTFIKFCCREALLSVSDGGTAQFRAELTAVQVEMGRLRNKYRDNTPASMGYVRSGTAMRVG